MDWTGKKRKSVNYLQDGKTEQFSICGLQFPGEASIIKEGFDQMYAHFSGYFFDMMRVDGKSTGAYFLFDSEIYEIWERQGLLWEFQDFIQEIVDDVKREHEDNIYEFYGVKVWFVYQQKITNERESQLYFLYTPKMGVEWLSNSKTREKEG